jgi:hypothetical protein
MIKKAARIKRVKSGGSGDPKGRKRDPRRLTPRPPLLSLEPKAQGGGVYPGQRPPQWPIFPKPGKEKTCSITKAPPRSRAKVNPNPATRGMRALLRAWRKRTRPSLSPLALARRTKSAERTSAIMALVKREKIGNAGKDESKDGKDQIDKAVILPSGETASREPA